MVGFSFKNLNMLLTEPNRGCKITSIFSVILSIETSFLYFFRKITSPLYTKLKILQKKKKLKIDSWDHIYKELKDSWCDSLKIKKVTNNATTFDRKFTQ
jgi:hypothetical protein